METVLECKALLKTYGDVAALKGIDLSLKKNRIVGLLGPNGSGKTTLIKLAAGLLTPTSGSILINGMAPCPETKAEVSYLPERTYLSGSMTVSETVRMFADFYENFSISKATGLIEKFGIPLNAKFKTLSKGTKEKLQLVLVMSRNTSLYLLDEPIAGVDPAARDLILETILSNYNNGATVLISTHLISDIEYHLDDFIFLKDGHITMSGSAEETRQETGKTLDQLFREVFRC